MTPKSFICSHCRREHSFGPGVYAYWDTVITHNCECGAVHQILQGQATLDHMNGKTKSV